MGRRLLKPVENWRSKIDTSGDCWLFYWKQKGGAGR
jgi:hypothetical protein